MNRLLLRRLASTRSSVRASSRLRWQQQASNYSPLGCLSGSSSSSSSGEWWQWWIQKPPKGSGFENFFPKNDKKNGEPSDNKESQTNDSHDKDDGKHRSSGDPNNNNNSNEWLESAVFALFVGLVIYVGSKNRTDNNKANGFGSATRREITWHEFLQLLQQRDVVKVVVSEENEVQRQTASVYMRPNAVGLTGSSTTHRTNSITTGYGDKEEEEGSHHEDQQDEAHAHHHEAMSAGFSSTTTTTLGDLPPATETISNTNKTSPIVYRLQIGSMETFERKLEDAQRALGRDPLTDIPVQYTATSTLGRALLTAVPALVMVAITFGMLRMMNGVAGGGPMGGGGGRGGMGGIFQIGKSTAKKISEHDVNVRFKDVAGCEEAKREIMEFVDFLQDPTRFSKLGAKIPKGALLCGPPGTGKTLLAKAVAGEARVPFYLISGADFIEMFVGVGPSRVRDLFKDARENAPCIVFIDEIDAVGRQRGRGGVGGNDERENTLNQLLVEMDGFSPSTGVVVLAGTNRVDILDQALTRPGRFDRQITVDKPDLAGRKAIFKVHLQGITLEDDVDDIAGRLAGLTPGFAGADIANICNEAAIVAARRKADSVSLDDFEKATDRIVGGLESNKIMSKEERSIVAHHEAGHAVAGWFLEHADPLLKVTIIPRAGGALGFAQYLPKEVFLRTHDQIMDIVCMALAGRASEEICFGRVTTGASDDLKRVTELVYSTIQLYGMNSRLGQLSFPKDPNAFFEERPYSEKTAKAMDEEARMIVDEAYQRTLNLLREKKQELEKVAHLLLKKETITHDDLVEAIGPRPFKGDPAYQEYVQRRKKDKEKHEQAGKTEREADNDSTGAPLNPGLACKP